MPHFFEFVHTLLEPMLGRNDILKMLPLVDDDLCELTELKKSEKIRLLAFKPRSFNAVIRPSACS